MIKANIFTKNEKIYAFTIENHADSIVCAGVSMLVINTINAIDRFDITGDFTVDVDEKNAVIHAEFHEIFNGKENKELSILLDTLYLGLCDTKEQYSNEIALEIEEVQQC